jgi:hypothetical protein
VRRHNCSIPNVALDRRRVIKAGYPSANEKRVQSVQFIGLALSMPESGRIHNQALMFLKIA